jgi:hypothetical protein
MRDMVTAPTLVAALDSLRVFPTAEVMAQRLEAGTQWEPNSGCLLWANAADRNGYGMVYFGYDGRRKHFVAAHRLAFYLACGPIPAGADICHKCDVPACCNAAHLFAGTRSDNIRDMLRKGRRKEYDRRGARDPNSKITEADVRAICQSADSGPALAARYGIGISQVARIRRGEGWPHLTDVPRQPLVWVYRAPPSGNANARVTAEQIAAIRTASGRHQDIAAQFGISKSQVGRIRRGESWRDAPCA